MRKLYAAPAAEPTDEGYRIFQTLFVLFGEGPRFGPVDSRTFQSILKSISDVAAIGNGRLHNLIKNWRSMSFTTLVLHLLLLEEAIIDKIVRERGHVLDGKFCRLVDEVQIHRTVLAKRFCSLFANLKELNSYPALRCEAHRVPVEADNQLGPFTIAISDPSARGHMTLEQLTDNFLYLLRFDYELVLGILARMEGFDDVLNLKTLSGSQETTDQVQFATKTF